MNNRVSYLSYFLQNNAYSNVLGRGSGYTFPPTLIGTVRPWEFWVGLGYLLALHIKLGSIGIWIAMAIGNAITGLAA